MSVLETLPKLKPLHIQNRKFIGSKYPLLSFIDGVIAAMAPGAGSLADLFAGTGVVAYRYAAKGMRVFASDTLYHNYLAAQCFLGAGPVDRHQVRRWLEELNRLESTTGYCAEAYGGTYFTEENAGKIDAVRDAIAAMTDLPGRERAALLTSLIYAADKVANTCGQYDAYLKHLGSSPYSATGRHQVDAMVYKPLDLWLPVMLKSPDTEVVCGSADDLIDRVEADILYLDPPYNGRQYVDNYHVLENLARWEKPALSGKTRKFDRQHLKSAYSSKRAAGAALSRLIHRARCGHILLSYNNEGIIADEVILAALSARGPVEIFEQPYAIFGNGAGRSGRRPIVERIFYCRVRNNPRL